MSRSYKHHPICTDRRNGAKWWKRQANRKVRHHKDVLNGKSYRKVYDSWEIHDHIIYESRNDAIAWYERNKDDLGWWLKDVNSLDDYLNRYWAHDFHRK